MYLVTVLWQVCEVFIIPVLLMKFHHTNSAMTFVIVAINVNVNNNIWRICKLSQFGKMNVIKHIFEIQQFFN